jgi:hypothetical protein
MKTTTTAIANAIRAGVAANFEPDNQEAELEKISELLLDMAASLEMDLVGDHFGLRAPSQKMRYSNLLGEIGWALDKSGLRIEVP